MDRGDRDARAIAWQLLDLGVFLLMVAIAADPELPKKVWYKVRLWYARWYHGRLDVRRRQEAMRRKVVDGHYKEDTYAAGSGGTDNPSVRTEGI